MSSIEFKDVHSLQANKKLNQKYIEKVKALTMEQRKEYYFKYIKNSSYTKCYIYFFYQVIMLRNFDNWEDIK